MSGSQPARIAPGAARGHLSLPFGAFYGLVDSRCSAESLDFAVLNADPHRIVERHSHDNAHFVLVINGLYTSSAAGADAISSGTALIFNPAGTTHRDRFVARSRSVEGRFLTLSIAADLMDAGTSEGAAPRIATAIHDANAIALAARLVHECLAHSADAALARESLAVALLTAVSAVRPIDAPTPPRWLALVREQLDDRCTESIALGDLARSAGVHPVHLARVFRRYLGCAPADYLRRRRLERSCVLLRETTWALSDIALRCGYVDQSHFSNTFRRHMHRTPGAYRRETPSS